MEDAEPAAEPAAEALEGMDEAPAEGMDAAARLGLPVKTAEDEAKEKEDAELRDLKKQVLEEEKRKRAERFNMEVDEEPKKEEPWAPPDGVPWWRSVWKSNVGRPTPSTRWRPRNRVCLMALRSGAPTPSTRLLDGVEVPRNLAHWLIPTQVALQEAAARRQKKAEQRPRHHDGF